MHTPILATKLYIPPPRPNLVHRPRLIERLNEGLHHKLTLISAPAGFGKTTLVSEWISNFELDSPEKEPIQNRSTERGPGGRERPKSKIQNRVAWLSLDDGDNDPAHFLTYLVAALQTIVPQIGAGVLAMLQSPQQSRDPVGREGLLTTLLNEITALPHKLILVLEDYHLLEAGGGVRVQGTARLSSPKSPALWDGTGAVDQALTFLLDHLPPQIHLIITTREDPPLPLARYRARGQLTEVRATDLRFTTAEAAGFLNQVMGLTLSVKEIAALENRTEGWIAGLQLAALSMQGRADTSNFIQAFTGDHHFILDYLAEEVLQQQPERVRSFLLQTSILDRLNGALCDAVIGVGDGQTAGRAMLVALEQNNLFVVPLDDKRQWYRYHHLFADVLQARTLAEQPEQVPILHQRASDWYEQNGLRADAIRHALAARDFVRAAGLIELAWPAMDGRFQTATWLGWARSLPDEVVRVRPVLCTAYGWAFLNAGALEAAEARLLDAERLLDIGTGAVVVDEAQFRHLPASIATARAYQAQARGDIPGSVKYGQRALALLPAEDHLRRGPAAALLALAQWALGDLAEAYQTLAAAMTNFQKVGNLHFAISGTYGLGDIRTVQGRLHDAIQIYTQVLQLALAQGEPLLRGTADLYLGLSELYREQDKRDTALWNLRHSEELGDQAALPDWRYRLCRTQARFKVSEGDWAGALDRLDEAERHYRPTPVPDLWPLAALKTRVWVVQGRLREAQRWVQEQGLAVDDELSFLREFDHITLARVLITDHAQQEALHLLDRLQRAAEAGGRIGSVIEIGVLQALAHQAQGNLSPALVALERSLKLAAPEGYVRLFVDEGLPMAHLLQEVAKRGVMPDYTRKLLAAFGTDQQARVNSPTHAQLSPPPSTPAAQALIEPLSQREVEVLQLIAQGLSNQEISAKLFLALSTVKGHNRVIFDKLQVQRRTEAVARARELGLV